jgi:hypothetical protein
VETLLIIVAIWLVLIGVYGAMPLLRRTPRPAPPRIASAPVLEAVQRQVEARPEPVVVPPKREEARTLPQPLAAPGDPYAEVSMLRAQVEHLRSELVALTHSAERAERARARRLRTGPYKDLPRPLRRQVHEVRSSGRRPAR